MSNFTEIYSLHRPNLASLSCPGKYYLPEWAEDRIFSSATGSKFLKIFQFTLDVCCYHFNARHAKGSLCKTNKEEW